MQIDLSALTPMSVFMPYAYGKILDLLQNGQRFVHYTSAEVAMSIIQNKEVWMRSTMVMNDFREVEHGATCLVEAYNSEDVGKPLKDFLELVYPGFCDEFASLFNPWFGHFRADTYIACLSEHDESEDIIGRLSMWRAYGARNGVALVINNGPITISSDALKANSSAVAYLTTDEFKHEFAKVSDRIRSSRAVVEGMGREQVLGMLFTAFRFAIICTKHPGFKEEREWRVVYAPTLEKSPVIRSSVKSVNGVAQIVELLPLRNEPQNGLFGADIPNLLDRLIIGPCQHPLATYKALVRVLEDAGVADAANKVVYSDIPLRQ